MAQTPTGTTFQVATAFSAAVVTTAVSNATEAIATVAAHTFIVGDILEVTSGWGRLNLRAVRVKAQTATTLTLEEFNSSDLNAFPAGSGIGSVRKVTTFTLINQIMNPQTSGGEPKLVTYRYVESDVDYLLSDGFNASSLTFEVDADAIGTTGYTAVKTLTESQANTIILMTLRKGSKIYQPCSIALSEAVRLQDGQINRVLVTVSGNNRVTRYAS